MFDEEEKGIILVDEALVSVCRLAIDPVPGLDPFVAALIFSMAVSIQARWKSSKLNTPT